MYKPMIIAASLLISLALNAEKNTHLACHQQRYQLLHSLLNNLQQIDSQQTFNQHKDALSKIDGEIKKNQEQINSLADPSDSELAALNKLENDREGLEMTLYGELAFLCFNHNSLFSQLEKVIPSVCKLMSRQISSYKSKQAVCPESQRSDFLITFCTWGNGNPKRLQQTLDQYKRSKDDLAALLFHLISQYSVYNQSGQMPPNSNWYKMIKLLLDKDVDLNARNDRQDTLLMVAVKNANGHNLELVDLLIKKGADVNARTSSGKPLYDAVPASPNQERLRQMLRKAGAKSDRLTDQDVQAMKKAVSTNDPKVILTEVLPLIKSCPEKDYEWAAATCYKLFDHKDDLVKINAIIQFLNIKKSLATEEKNTIRDLISKLMESEDPIAFKKTKKLVKHLNEQLLWDLKFYHSYPKNSIYKASSCPVSFKLPDLGTNKLCIIEKNLDRHTTSEIRIEAENGNAAVIILTKAQNSHDEDTTLLEKISNKIEGQAPDNHKPLIRGLSDDKGTPYLEVISRNTVYDPYFPYGYRFSETTADAVVSCSASLFLLRKNYLIELAVFLENPKKLKEKELFTQIRDKLVTLKDSLSL